MPILTVGQHRLLYIHVPKTGGTSVEHLLRSYGGTLSAYAPQRAPGMPCTPQHFHREIIENVFAATDGSTSGRGTDFDFVFMTVRHPMTRILSEYRYQRSADLARRRRRPSIASVLNFDSWVRYALYRYRNNAFLADNHIRPQSEFYALNAKVFRLEEGLTPIKNAIDALLDSQGALPPTRTQESIDRSGGLSQLRHSTEVLIRRFYAQDLALWYPDR